MWLKLKFRNWVESYTTSVSRMVDWYAEVEERVKTSPFGSRLTGRSEESRLAAAQLNNGNTSAYCLLYISTRSEQTWENTGIECTYTTGNIFIHLYYNLVNIWSGYGT